MSKPSKEFTWRMEGMLYALNIAKKDGVEALEKEIKKRGFFRISIGIPQKDYDEILDFLVQNLHNTYKTVAGITLHDTFGFGKKRLTDFEIAFDRKTRDATDFDYLGQHYATLEDYATQLRDDFGMHIDVERVAKCQEWYKGEEAKEMADVRELIKVLRDGGFEDAAKFIEMTELDLKLQDLKNAFDGMKEENKRLKFSNSMLEEELQEYRRLEEQGLLLKLPCKVGDTAYHVIKDKVAAPPIYISEYEITDVSVNAVQFADDWWTFEEMPRMNAFLTKSEAEKALEDMRKEK